MLWSSVIQWWGCEMNWRGSQSEAEVAVVCWMVLTYDIVWSTTVSGALNVVAIGMNDLCDCPPWLRWCFGHRLNFCPWQRLHQLRPGDRHTLWNRSHGWHQWQARSWPHNSSSTVIWVVVMNKMSHVPGQIDWSASLTQQCWYLVINQRCIRSREVHYHFFRPMFLSSDHVLKLYGLTHPVGVWILSSVNEDF